MNKKKFDQKRTELIEEVGEYVHELSKKCWFAADKKDLERFVQVEKEGIERLMGIIPLLSLKYISLVKDGAGKDSLFGTILGASEYLLDNITDRLMKEFANISNLPSKKSVKKSPKKPEKKATKKKAK